MIRFNEEQKKRKEAGEIHFKVGSAEFKKALKDDPFFNALKVKFGYAITCHKSQGGEWDKVFVDYQGMISLKSHPLRWCYTATTRGVNAVYAINTPHFDKLDKFKISPVGSIGTLPKQALALERVKVSPFHKETDHKCKSLKYWEILEKLENTNYKIVNIDSLGVYQERYTLFYNGLEIILDGYHKDSGHFISPFKVINTIEESRKAEIEEVFNSDFNQYFQINYKPELDFLADLYSSMQSCCEDLQITITNIISGSSNYVNYYMKTDSSCSYIQFYYNDKGQLTTAMPKTFNCNIDQKLEGLIQKLLTYAS